VRECQIKLALTDFAGWIGSVVSNREHAKEAVLRPQLSTSSAKAALWRFAAPRLTPTQLTTTASDPAKSDLAEQSAGYAKDQRHKPRAVTPMVAAAPVRRDVQMEQVHTGA
jgi:hypothetical protein